MSDAILDAQQLLGAVEYQCNKVGLNLNAKKMEYMTINIQLPHLPLKTNNLTLLREVDNLRYLEAWVQSSEQDVKIRRALAWKALNGMQNIWKSNILRKIKLSLFQSTVETIFLYDSESWTQTKNLQKSIDGMYTRMFRVVFNVQWQDHISNVALYKGLPRLSSKIASRRMGVAGHCQRHPDLPTNMVLLWEPIYGHRQRGRPIKTMVDVLMEDAQVTTTEELKRCMEDRLGWVEKQKARLRAT